MYKDYRDPWPPIPNLSEEEMVLNYLSGRIYKWSLNSNWSDFVTREEVRAQFKKDTATCCAIWYKGDWKGAWSPDMKALGMAP